MNKWNYAIDFLKFVFSIVIMLSHTEMMFQNEIHYKRILGGAVEQSNFSLLCQVI